MLRKSIFVVVAILPVMLIATAGCGQGADIVTRHHGVDLISGEAAYGMYVDFKNIRQDEDLSAMYDYLGEGSADGELEDFGLSISQVDFAAGTMDGGIFCGCFDYNEIRESLRKLEFEEDVYEDVELWTGYYSGYGDTAVAIFESGLVYGEVDVVKAHVRVIRGIDKSLYQKEDVEQIMNRLPNWSPIIIVVMIDTYGQLDFSGAVAQVFAFDKADRDNLKLAMVVKFTSEDAAIEALSDAETYMEEGYEGMGIKANQNGTFVEIEAIVPIELFT